MGPYFCLSPALLTKYVLNYVTWNISGVFETTSRRLQIIVDVSVVENGIKTTLSNDYILVLIRMVLADLLSSECLIRDAQKVLHA